jgi:2,5-diamino-6-(ribosylamino)-4(3H)-pyrimidinone 5'-phosphate reductase
LSTSLKEKEEKIQQIIAALADESAKGTPIIVEGKKDLEALRAFGVKGTVLTAKTGGKSFLDLSSQMEETKAAEVILLLDFDRRGKQGIRLLKQHLEHTEMKPNITFWRELSALTGKEVQCIEGLTSYLKNPRTKIGVSALNRQD